MRERLIVALDAADRAQLRATAARLQGEVGMVKLGLEAFTALGPSVVADMRSLGLQVFLDLKLHDIPRTVGRAVAQAQALGVELLTIHAAGGPAMVRAAAEAAGNTKIIAVTVLTSLDDSDADAIGFQEGTGASARRLGALALANGANGLVCSGLELDALAALGGLRVVPGIRPQAADDDQRRTVTPSEAVAHGADYLVVGRPILRARDPVVAAREIVAQMGAT